MAPAAASGLIPRIVKFMQNDSSSIVRLELMRFFRVVAQVGVAALELHDLCRALLRVVDVGEIVDVATEKPLVFLVPALILLELMVRGEYNDNVVRGGYENGLFCLFVTVMDPHLLGYGARVCGLKFAVSVMEKTGGAALMQCGLADAFFQMASDAIGDEVWGADIARGLLEAVLGVVVMIEAQDCGAEWLSRRREVYDVIAALQRMCVPPENGGIV
jgi:hypothetical protein